MTKQADLIAYLFEGQQHLLSAELLAWMDVSTRFTAFVETYRDKIRKKIRVTREPESILDLRGELEVARGLLSDRIKAAQERGIQVVNLPGRNSRAVAEFTLGLIFAQMKNSLPLRPAIDHKPEHWRHLLTTRQVCTEVPVGGHGGPDSSEKQHQNARVKEQPCRTKKQ
jgi:hypothetical protein